MFWHLLTRLILAQIVSYSQYAWSSRKKTIYSRVLRRDSNVSSQTSIFSRAEWHAAEEKPRCGKKNWWRSSKGEKKKQKLKKNVFVRGQRQAHGVVVIVFILKTPTHLTGLRTRHATAPLLGAMVVSRVGYSLF